MGDGSPGPGVDNRVLIVCPGADTIRGGIELHARAVADELNRQGLAASLVNKLPPRQPYGTLHETHVVFEGVHRLTLLHLLLRPDILNATSLTIFTHASFAEPLQWGWVVRNSRWGRVGRRLLAVCFDRLLTGKILSRFQTVAVLSSREGDDIRQKLGIQERAVFISPVFARGAETASFPEEAPPPMRQPYVFGVGRIELRKNFQSMLPALDGTDIGFVLAGKDHGGLVEVLRYAKKFPSVRFKYLGEVSNLEKFRWIRSALATVLPSHLEGVPASVLESLAVGVPAVASNRSYLPSMKGLYFCDPLPGSVRQVLLSLQTNRAKGCLALGAQSSLPSCSSVVRALVDRLMEPAKPALSNPAPPQ